MLMTGVPGAAVVALMKATTTIPMVFAYAVDPVRVGLMASLARPGGHITGVSSLNTGLDAKRLELITDIVPRPAGSACS
jgi:putative ABC transport system substrate-binding protein